MLRYYTTLHIFGAPWRVYIADAWDNETLETAEGCCEYASAQIWIRSDAAKAKLLTVLLHEINHAICYECPAVGDMFSHLGKKMSPVKRQEAWNTSYSAALVGVLKDNHMLKSPRKCKF